MKRSLLPRRLLPQLMLIVVGVLLLLIVLHAIHTQREQTEMARAGIESQARALARSLASAAAPALVLGSIDELDDLLQRAAEFPGVLEIQASDAEGRLLSHFIAVPGNSVTRVIDPPATRIAPPPGTADQVEVGDERMLAWYPVSAGSLLGWIRADLSTQAIDDIRYRIGRSTLISAVLAIVGGSLLVFLFLRQPMAALERARQFAVGLAAADGQTLPHSAAPEEIEDLEAALNHASLRLNEQRRNLAALIEQLRANEAQLGERNEELNAIFDLSADGFVSFDAGRRVTYVNPGFTRLTGLEAAALTGLDEAAFSKLLAARCAGDANGLDLAALRSAEASPADPAMDGTSVQRRAIETLAPASRILEISLRTSATGIVAQLLHVRDITRESEVDRMKSEFLAHAAHELRTPMACIHGFSELLLSGDYADAERREMLDVIFRQSDLMAAIINELLDLVRIEERRGKDFELARLDAAALLSEAIAHFKLPAARQPPQLRLPDSPCWITADRKKLLQVINNMLSNAYKYSPDGGAVTAELCAGDRFGHPGHVALRVSDHGVGMSEEAVGRVFERFYRADTSGKIPGTGLGMSIVKEIVELHGGSVSLSSQPGAGTTVSIFLPQS